jgi:hypothetical protein
VTAIAGDQRNLAMALAAAQRIFDDPDSPIIYEPRGADECAAAVEALANCFASAGGTVRRILENSRAGAGVLSGDRLQGLSEIVQNADDAGATRVHFHQTSDAVIAVHDGAPLTLRNVHALAAPWLTTKGGESAATGRFGIGLVTLHSLSPTFEMQSGSYHLRLGDPTIESLPIAPRPALFAGPGDTVITVPVAAGTLVEDELYTWGESWDDTSLLFLSTVRKVSFTAGGRFRRLKLHPESVPGITHQIAGTEAHVHRCRLTAPDGRSWLVNSTDLPSPPGLLRDHKRTAPTTPVAVALPEGQWAGGGYLAAGLPVMRTKLPMHANAQFDPVTSRQGFAESDWNKALAGLVAGLWSVAVIDLFANSPTAAWQVIPLAVEMTTSTQNAARLGLVEELENLIVDIAVRQVASSAALPVDGKLVALTDLAVEEPLLEGLLTPAEIAALANLAYALPGACRDDQGRWREVLALWRQRGANLPRTVTVSDALPLTEDTTRETSNTIALVAVAIACNLASRLSLLRCIVLADASHIAPPDGTNLQVLIDDNVGLSATLAIASQLHPFYADDAPAAVAVSEWLRQRGSLVSATDSLAVLQLLAAAGRRDVSLAAPLTDPQVRALREALESLGQSDWERLCPDIGRAITLDAVQYTEDGKTFKTTAHPTDAYQPKAIDREVDSFAVAADKTPGLTWIASRYATVLRSSLGRAGLGAQRFLRLLGAETAPRLRAIAEVNPRFRDRRKGLPQGQQGSPTERTESLQDISATYTLDDHQSPDLQRVLENIASETNPTQRRKRALTTLAVLGRAWPTLSNYAQVQAAFDRQTWQVTGSIRAWWLWQAGTVAWLDDASSSPSRPLDLRLRTQATLAVHGSTAAGYIHPDFSNARPDVLTALGIAGEPHTRQLLTRLQQLRDHGALGLDMVAETSVVYQALAERTGRASRTSHEMPLRMLRQQFSAGVGLIWTHAGWRPPTEVLRGDPVFGRYRPFAPQIPGADSLWQTLQLRVPSLDDCLDVMREVARGSDDDPDTNAITLDVLRLMCRLLEAKPATENQSRKLQRTPLLTSQGWLTRRPVFAVDDPSLARGIGERLAVWVPGGEIAQFESLVGPLRLHKVEGTSVRVIDDGDAYVDEASTDLFRDTVRLLQEDLTRNDPHAHSALDMDWAQLASVVVHVSPDLRVHVEGLPDGHPLTVAVDSRIDRDNGVLYVREPEAVKRADSGGRAIAGLFHSDQRRLSQAWLAAVEAAEEGRAAVTLRLASERAAEEQDAAKTAIKAKLAEVQVQVHERHGRKAANAKRAATKAEGPTSATPSGDGAIPTGTSKPEKERVLVDPASLVVVDRDGTIVSGTRSIPPATKPRREPVLPDPKAGGRVPQARSTHRGYSDLEKETVGLQLVRDVLGSDIGAMVDLRAQHGVGADAIDELDQFYELKVYASTEPDHVVLEDSQIRRAISTDGFFLVVVSGVEGENATPRVRVIADPLTQLRMSEKSKIEYFGIRDSHSLVYDLKPNTQPQT